MVTMPTDQSCHAWRRPVDVGGAGQREVIRMSHPRSDTTDPPLEQVRGIAAQRTRHTGDSGRQQNDHGDIVVPAGLGEIVLLPRLWDFELVRDVGGGLTLVSRSGLVAFADIPDGTSARITEVIVRESAVEDRFDSGAS